MEVLRFLKRNRLAFTLVELLVVILVLGVLLAIALPSFLNAQNSAKDASAKTKLSTAYKGVKIFAGAHESAYPTGSDLVSALNEAQPGLMNEGDPASTADGKVGVCSESSSSEVKLVAVSASGTSFLMTTTASTGAYTIAPGACDASPPPEPDPVTNVTTNAIPGASGTIYFQRIKSNIVVAVGSLNADGTGFDADLGFPGDDPNGPTVNQNVVASYNAETIVKNGSNGTLTWARPDGTNLHSLNLHQACQDIGGDWGGALYDSWDGGTGVTDISPNGDALRVWCRTDRFLTIDTTTGATSRWVSPWEGGPSFPGYFSLYQGLRWPLSPDGTQRVGAPNTNDQGVYVVPIGTKNHLTAGTRVIDQGPTDTYDDNTVWSRDGTKIAWMRFNPDINQSELWVANADGTDKVKTAAENPWDYYYEPPVFSPDGQWILYTYSPNSGGSMGIMAVKTDGTGSPVTVTSQVDGVVLRTLAWTGTGESFNSFQD